VLLAAALAASLLAGCASRHRGGGELPRTRIASRGAPSDGAHASFVRARRLVGLGRIDEAARVLERLVDAAPHYIPAHRLYQDVLSDSVSAWEVRRRYADRLRAEPDDADALYLAARIEPDRERQSALFAAALDSDSMHPWAYVGRALVHLRNGELDAAAGSAVIASELAPHLSLPWVFLGRMSLSRGDPTSALASFDAAISRDPRDVRAHVGRIAAARDLGDSAAASVAALAALRLAPGDRRVISVVSDELVGAAAPVVVRDALDITTAALSDVGVRWPVSVLRARLRLSLGDASGAWAESRTAARDGAGHADVARIQRRAGIRAGTYGAAVSGFLARAPEALSDSENLYAARWRTLLRRSCAADANATPRTLLGLGEALLAVGWRSEARVVLARAGAFVDRDADDQCRVARRAAGRRMAAATAFDHFLDDVRRIGRALRLAARSGDHDAGVEDVLAVIGSASRRRLGRDVTEGALVRSYPFLGEFAASVTSTGAFADELDARGLLLMVGRRRGEGPRVVVGRIQLVRANAASVVRGEELTFDECWIETAGLPPELAGMGGGLAGLTIDRFVILRLDTVLRGAVLPASGLSLVSRAATTRGDLLALDTPSAVARRIEAQLDSEGRLSDALLASVRRHELGHVLDAHEMLPVARPPWRGLWLVLRHGFDGRAVEAHLEARAAVTALAESDSPRAALAALLAFLPNTAGSTAHAEGYLGAVRRAVRIVADDPDAFPTVDRNFNIAQQLDRLSPAEARELGRRLLRYF